MDTYSPTDIGIVRQTAAELRRQLAAIDSCDHDLEREGLVDQLKAFLAPTPGRTIHNIADELADERIRERTQEFVAAVPQFYRSRENAQRVAENSDTIRELQHRRTLLNEAPLIPLATLLESVLSQAIDSHPAFGAGKPPAGTALAGQTTGTQSPSKTA